jgi:hypothetical protein
VAGRSSVLNVCKAFGVSLYATRFADLRRNGPRACKIFWRFSSVIFPVLILALFADAFTISRQRLRGNFLTYINVKFELSKIRGIKSTLTGNLPNQGGIQ